MASKATITSQAPPTQSRLGLSINPGLMRSTITFLVDTSYLLPQTDTGSLSPAEWTVVGSTRAYARRLTGVDYWQMLQFGHRVDARFTMRWFRFTVDSVKTTPTDAMRIMWNDDMYRIIKVDDRDDLHIELNIEGLYISKRLEEV